MFIVLNKTSSHNVVTVNAGQCRNIAEYNSSSLHSGGAVSNIARCPVVFAETLLSVVITGNDITSVTLFSSKYFVIAK
jgi:hypothetical protein